MNIECWGWAQRILHIMMFKFVFVSKSHWAQWNMSRCPYMSFLLISLSTVKHESLSIHVISPSLTEHSETWVIVHTCHFSLSHWAQWNMSHCPYMSFLLIFSETWVVVHTCHFSLSHWAQWNMSHCPYMSFLLISLSTVKHESLSIHVISPYLTEHSETWVVVHTCHFSLSHWAQWNMSRCPYMSFLLISLSTVKHESLSIHVISPYLTEHSETWVVVHTCHFSLSHWAQWNMSHCPYMSFLLISLSTVKHESLSIHVISPYLTEHSETWVVVHTCHFSLSHWAQWNMSHCPYMSFLLISLSTVKHESLSIHVISPYLTEHSETWVVVHTCHFSLSYWAVKQSIMSFLLLSWAQSWVVVHTCHFSLSHWAQWNMSRCPYMSFLLISLSTVKHESLSIHVISPYLTEHSETWVVVHTCHFSLSHWAQWNMSHCPYMSFLLISLSTVKHESLSIHVISPYLSEHSETWVVVHTCHFSLSHWAQWNMSHCPYMSFLLILLSTVKHESLSIHVISPYLTEHSETWVIVHTCHFSFSHWAQWNMSRCPYMSFLLISLSTVKHESLSIHVISPYLTEHSETWVFVHTCHFSLSHWAQWNMSHCPYMSFLLISLSTVKHESLSIHVISPYLTEHSETWVIVHTCHFSLSHWAQWNMSRCPYMSFLLISLSTVKHESLSIHVISPYLTEHSETWVVVHTCHFSLSHWAQWNMSRCPYMSFLLILLSTVKHESLSIHVISPYLTEHSETWVIVHTCHFSLSTCHFSFSHWAQWNMSHCPYMSFLLILLSTVKHESLSIHVISPYLTEHSETWVVVHTCHFSLSHWAQWNMSRCPYMSFLLISLSTVKHESLSIHVISPYLTEHSETWVFVHTCHFSLSYWAQWNMSRCPYMSFLLILLSTVKHESLSIHVISPSLTEHSETWVIVHTCHFSLSHWAQWNMSHCPYMSFLLISLSTVKHESLSIHVISPYLSEHSETWVVVHTCHFSLSHWAQWNMSHCPYMSFLLILLSTVKHESLSTVKHESLSIHVISPYLTEHSETWVVVHTCHFSLSHWAQWNMSRCPYMSFLLILLSTVKHESLSIHVISPYLTEHSETWVVVHTCHFSLSYWAQWNMSRCPYMSFLLISLSTVKHESLSTHVISPYLTEHSETWVVVHTCHFSLSYWAQWNMSHCPYMSFLLISLSTVKHESLSIHVISPYLTEHSETWVVVHTCHFSLSYWAQWNMSHCPYMSFLLISLSTVKHESLSIHVISPYLTEHSETWVIVHTCHFSLSHWAQWNMSHCPYMSFLLISLSTVKHESLSTHVISPYLTEHSETWVIVHTCHFSLSHWAQWNMSRCPYMSFLLISLSTVKHESLSIHVTLSTVKHESLSIHVISPYLVHTCHFSLSYWAQWNMSHCPYMSFLLISLSTVKHESLSIHVISPYLTEHSETWVIVHTCHFSLSYWAQWNMSHCPYMSFLLISLSTVKHESLSIHVISPYLTEHSETWVVVHTCHFSLSHWAQGNMSRCPHMSFLLNRFIRCINVNTKFRPGSKLLVFNMSVDESGPFLGSLIVLRVSPGSSKIKRNNNKPTVHVVVESDILEKNIVPKIDEPLSVRHQGR